MWWEVNVGRNDCGVEGNECGVEKSGGGGGVEECGVKRMWGEMNVE